MKLKRHKIGALALVLGGTLSLWLPAGRASGQTSDREQVAAPNSESAESGSVMSVDEGQAGGGCPTCDHGCLSCNSGGASCSSDGGCFDNFHWPWPSGWITADTFRDLSVFTGVQGFNDPFNLNFGDFGFHEGFNWGVPALGSVGLGNLGLSAQFGAAFEHSDLLGDNGGHFNQYFVTTGLFHRATGDCGVQGGAVYDMLANDFKFVDFTVGQVRTNLSYVLYGNEIGIITATSVKTAIDVTDSTLDKPVDTYSLYYGQHFSGGGEAHYYGGYADGLGAVMGADFSVPVNQRFVVAADVDYLIPNKTSSESSFPAGLWQVGINLEFHPGCHARDTYDSPNRPLFNVADNATFFWHPSTLH